MDNSIFDKAFLGKHEDIPIYLNWGSYGPFLNYNNIIYGIPKCFQTNKFNLKSAIKIITYNQQKQLKIKQIEEKFDKKLNQTKEEIVDVK